MTNVALYARVSTKDRGQDSENQLVQLREFAATQGWPIVCEFTDAATGKNSDREALKAMFNAASRREFDTLLFWSLDRLSREGVLKTLQHLNRLSDYGVSYRSFTEQYLDSTGIFRDAVISILATVAKQEHTRIVERTKAGLERARLAGRIGGRPRVVVDRVRVAELKAQGLSVRAIAGKLGLTVGTAQNAIKSLC